MNKRKSSKWSVLVVIGFMIYFVYVLIGQQKVLYAKNVEMNNVQAKVAEEMSLNEDLKNQKEMLATDEYVEKVAREKLGMVKPGEKIFIDINK
jgi:cell division protein FtsL